MITEFMSGKCPPCRWDGRGARGWSLGTRICNVGCLAPTFLIREMRTNVRSSARGKVPKRFFSVDEWGSEDRGC